MDMFLVESSSSSDCSSSANGYSLEEELMLASQNPKKKAGRKKLVYRGVRRRNSGKWVCEVREPSKQSRVWLGTYPTPEMAARAHDVAVLAMRGRSACLNFADSVWRLPVPESNNVRDIQKAAAKAAEAFGQTNDALKAVEVVETNEVPEVVLYVDEEEIFGMPELIASMAEGLMVAPPQMVGYVKVVDNCVDWSLRDF
ncbi:hypothetical protein QVD17_08195 [Tagetes erecta]|uniref:AP2/ERF domain-containing protein n=1 Tax=Tagetes erecta TaxID=13708 RepID=A0AAD8KZ91_TARER|nr:hypothetical protein QVD17_08195 [Tagetes erecta]